MPIESPDLYSVSLDGIRHSPIMMLLGPKYVTPFNKFLQRLRRERIPVRLSWLVEGYGSGGLGLREYSIRYFIKKPPGKKLRPIYR